MIPSLQYFERYVTAAGGVGGGVGGENVDTPEYLGCYGNDLSERPRTCVLNQMSSPMRGPGNLADSYRLDVALVR